MGTLFLLSYGMPALIRTRLAIRVLDVPESGKASMLMEWVSSLSVMFILGVGTFEDPSSPCQLHKALTWTSFAEAFPPSSSEVSDVLGDGLGVCFFLWPFLELLSSFPLKQTCLKWPYLPQSLQVASRALHCSLWAAQSFGF